jgi:6-phosphogluconolactonase (cycloisomerase 2 family)
VAGSAGAEIFTLATDPAGKYVFSLDAAHNQLLSSTVNRSSGALAAADAATLAGAGLPDALVVSPNGKFVYVASVSVIAPNSGVLATFAVLANGKLGALGTTAIPGVTSLAIDPSGQRLYVGADLSNVNVYALDPVSGSATFQGLTGSSSGIDGLMLAPGGFAYSLAQGVGAVDAYPILSDGTFGSTLGRVTAGPNPNGIAMDADGRFVYVSDEVAPRITVFKADPKTGALSAGTDFTTAVLPQSVAADPTGRFVYAVNQDKSVSAFSIDGATGMLTPVGTNVSGSSAPSARPFSMVLTK